MKQEVQNIWLSRLSNSSEIMRLVRGRLGCACDPAVFEHYKIETLQKRFGPVVQLIIGDRLLLWIMGATGFVISETTLRSILEEGCQERNQRELNRFRLVLEGKWALEDKAIIELVMEHFDSKIHVHLLKAR